MTSRHASDLTFDFRSATAQHWSSHHAFRPTTLSTLSDLSTLSTIPSRSKSLLSCLQTRQASTFSFYWVSSILTRSYALQDDNWQDYVRTDEFDQHCITVHNRRSSSSGSSDSSARRKIFEEDDASSATSESVESAHDVPKLEKYYYYFDIRSDGCLGPPLIYRTSKDQFTPPTGPENDPRPMRLLQVDDHAKLGKDDLWPAVRDKVRDLLEA